MLQIRLLRLPHQHERDGEDAERKEAHRLVCERHHAADEAVDEVVREKPGEPLLEHGPPALVAFEGERDREQAHVDREVHGAGEEAEPGDCEPVLRSTRKEPADLEDARGPE